MSIFKGTTEPKSIKMSHYQPPILPDAYQEVEYIQSSGTQYIDTGYNPQTSTEFDVTYEWVSYPQQYQNVFGTRKTYNSYGYFIGYNSTGTSNYYGFGSTFNSSTSIAIGGSGVKNISYHSGVLSDGTHTQSVSVNQAPYGNMAIFGDNDNGTVNELGALKLYSLKLYESGTLVRNYVPCYRKSDSVIGLYDTVNSAFFTNAGSGTFTKGSNAGGGWIDAEAKAVYLGNTKVRPTIVNFATQGPCPDGFHVPLSSDWSALLTMCSSLGITASSNWREYLKLPYAGYRGNSNGNTGYQGSGGYYWSASIYTSNKSKAYGMQFYSTNPVYAPGDVWCTQGASIRPFRNEAVVPNSNWTVLKQGTGNSGVFYNSSSGLISISSDGTNWITISDKNVGATTPYSYGDSLSQDNCGGYFQWGNNYMFPYTGTVTKSSSSVNASSYGPGNYYSSSNFITTVPRDSSNNQNLRGGVDGNVPVS